ncbi:MAG: 3-oxoacyl-[acyl-carrier-protein] reductase FabG [Gammaproteobacteria bacterium]|nr:3-oxoacyl-[acyl-carrier-protein] reductase FabG [Gammaproteobacteria bacterium]
MRSASPERVAIVTGASRGIGAAILRELARDGVRVIGTATGEAGLEAIRRSLADIGATGDAFRLDVTDPAAIDGLVAETERLGLAPSILVNNAAITRDNLLMRMKDEDWDMILNADLTSVFRLCKGYVRGMMKQRYGRIINITSVVGAMGNAGQTNYAAAKAGMIGFTKSLAREVASRGITVNAVAPGFIVTDMTGVLTDEQRAALAGQIPLGRFGAPEDVAAAVAFLASDAAGYITGETLHVNGGMYMP